MIKKYNTTYLIYIFEFDDIIIVVIPAKNQTVNDAPRIKAYIMNISYENWYSLQTEYGILTNLYLTSMLN